MGTKLDGSEEVTRDLPIGSGGMLHGKTGCTKLAREPFLVSFSGNTMVFARDDTGFFDLFRLANRIEKRVFRPFDIHFYKVDRVEPGKKFGWVDGGKLDRSSFHIERVPNLERRLHRQSFVLVQGRNARDYPGMWHNREREKFTILGILGKFGTGHVEMFGKWFHEGYPW